jgi:hypothetical protein
VSFTCWPNLDRRGTPAWDATKNIDLLAIPEDGMAVDGMTLQAVARRKTSQAAREHPGGFSSGAID